MLVTAVAVARRCTTRGCEWGGSAGTCLPLLSRLAMYTFMPYSTFALHGMAQQARTFWKAQTLGHLGCSWTWPAAIAMSHARFTVCTIGRVGARYNASACAIGHSEYVTPAPRCTCMQSPGT